MLKTLALGFYNQFLKPLFGEDSQNQEDLLIGNTVNPVFDISGWNRGLKRYAFVVAGTSDLLFPAVGKRLRIYSIKVIVPAENTLAAIGVQTYNLQFGGPSMGYFELYLDGASEEGVWINDFEYGPFGIVGDVNTPISLVLGLAQNGNVSGLIVYTEEA